MYTNKQKPLFPTYFSQAIHIHLRLLVKQRIPSPVGKIAEKKWDITHCT